MTFATAYVPYGMIITQLLHVARHRRDMIKVDYGRDPKTVNEIFDAYAVGVTGPRQSGKTHFAKEAWLTDPGGTIVIVADILLAQDMCSELNYTKERYGLNLAGDPNHHILSVNEMLRTNNLYGSAIEAEAATKFTIEINKDDPDPQATMARIMEEYQERRQALLDRQLPQDHPLHSVRTIIVDGMRDGERSGLNFARLVRFGQLGGQKPEYILLN
jgi:hypothetical protein